MSIQVTLALRYMRGRTLRTALTTMAIAFGVMIMFGLNGILPGLTEALQRTMLATAGQVDLAVTSKSGGTFPATTLTSVTPVEGVAAATPVLRRTVSLPESSSASLASVVVVGIDPSTSQSVLPLTLASGRLLSQSDAESVDGTVAAVLPTTVADALGVTLGESLTLPSADGSVQLTVVGLLDMPAVPGVDEVYVTLSAAQAILAAEDQISEIDVAFAADVDRSAVETAVADALGPDFTTGAISSASPLSAGLQVARFVMTTLGLFAIAMGGFVILNTFRTLVAERRHDIGMLRAIGASRRTVAGIFVVEGLLQGVLGTAVGLVAGWLLATGASAAMRSMVTDLIRIPESSVIFTPSIWALSIGFGIGVTVLAAVLPARSAARLTPLEALRPALGENQEPGAARRAWLGLACILIAIAGLVSGRLSLAGISVILLLLGLILGAQVAVRPITTPLSRVLEAVFRREGGVARANLQRAPARAAVTASTVMVSIALIIALVGTLSSVLDGFTSYLDKSMGADFIVVPRNLLLSGGVVGAGPELRQQVADVPGIGDVTTLRVATSLFNDTRVQTVGSEPEAFSKVAGFEFAEGSSSADLARLSEPGSMMVNGVFAARNGVKKGDSITMETPQGTREFSVVAIANDYLNAKLATVYVSQDTLASVFGVSTDVVLLANAAPGADEDAVLAELSTIVGDYPSFVLYSTSQWRATQIGIFDQMRVLYFGLALVLAVPSLLALLNTLAIGVLSRTREIGMLRAVGSTRRQVRRMVTAEALLLAALGTIAGLVAGLWLGYVMVDALNGIGLPMPYRFPWVGIVLAIAVALAFATLAALIPARQAARLNIVRALRYE